jgi:hypothetical protein
LEVYSEHPDDLSGMLHSKFIEVYRQIIAGAVAKLKQDRYACFVVGDFRDRNGNYRNFVSDTIGAFEAAGAKLYNEAILVTAAGSLPIRAGKQFTASRKLGKTHQNVLVFVKGDGKKAAKACGVVEFGDLEEPGSVEVGAEALRRNCIDHSATIARSIGLRFGQGFKAARVIATTAKKAACGVISGGCHAAIGPAVRFHCNSSVCRQD